MKNVICGIFDDTIKAVDCSDGKTLFELPTTTYSDCFMTEQSKTLLLKINIEIKADRDPLYNDWAVKRIDELTISDNIHIGWVKQQFKFHFKGHQVEFAVGNMNILNQLVDKYNDVDFPPLIIERHTNHSSWYTDKEVCLRETIKVYYKRRQSVYNRQLDVFMSACYKLGLNIKKYNSRNMKDYSSFQILTEICKDLNYNILAII